MPPPSELPDDLIDKHCPECFIHYAAPRAMFDRKNQESEHWFCPNGHRIVFKVSALTKAQQERDALRRERDRFAQNEAYLNDRLTFAERQRTALKGQLTKVNRRIGRGVCPCCNRTFADLQRHMTAKHAGFVAEPVPKEAAA
jgi:hypothetical protein